MEISDSLVELVNIADSLDEEKLKEIGKTAAAGFRYDASTREEWLKKVEDWMNLALQVAKDKTFPWPKASNIKYPLLTIAALQFSARAYPALVNTASPIVKVEVVGTDPDGQKINQASRVGKHMSYQILNEMDDWENDMDKLLLMVPIIGCAFKKTFHDPMQGRNISKLVHAKDLVVDYYAKSLETARRISEIIPLHKNEIVSRQRNGVFLEVDLGGDPQRNVLQNGQLEQDQAGKMGQREPGDDIDIPYTIVEQHCWIDLDEDGYEEPYIVTFNLQNETVLRITARYQMADVLKAEGKIYSIIPTKYYTKFGFIPNPDGGFYDVGFGLLLSTINEASNTLINQLIDAGTLNNLQSGFLSRGVRIKGGSYSMTPGEWKVVNSTGDDLRKGIVPLPTKEPSNVLFSLLGLLLQAGRDLTAVQEINVGKMPGQNTPATTTMAAIQEGQKVFTAIYKRIYRSLDEEFTKLFRLNKQFLNVQNQPYIEPQDYQASAMRIMPAADPNVASDAIKLERAQSNMSLIGTGLINPQLAVKELLEAQQQPNIEQLMQAPPPPEDPKIALEKMKLQLEDKWKQQEFTIRMAEAQAKAMVAKSTAMLNMAKAESESDRSEFEQLKAQADQLLAIGEKFSQRYDQEHQQEMDRRAADREDRKLQAEVIQRELDRQAKAKERVSKEK